jgi:hypothetical protein
MDASGHDRFDQGTTVLVFDPSLGLKEPASVGPKGQSLILKVALPTLVTDWTVERVVEEKELQDGFPGLFHQRGLGKDLHPLHGRHRTGSHWLGGLEDLHQAHSAVSGNG